MKSKKLNNLLRLFILWNMTIFYSSLAIANQEEYKYPFQKKIVILKLTGDVIGKENVQCANFNFNTKTNVKNGTAIAMEYIYFTNKALGLGAGIKYQFFREVNDQTDDIGKFRFVPLYFLLKVQKQTGIYSIGQIGYNSLAGNSYYGSKYSGGLYYGIGFGFSTKNNSFIELLYGVNNGIIENFGTMTTVTVAGATVEYIPAEVKYTQIGISFGFKFGVKSREINKWGSDRF
ncbi:MAG: hypothetical protein COT16_01875 [Elusimicrobia bacterium CG08_land_8_20_14_0_20_44_26]|nr:MAG: hypothetical protein COT16_01875 [Elusimicrobia bacterium CG08_land_8_20_14_0_20_44_26]